MQSNWKIFLSVKRKDKALQVFSQLQKEIGFTIGNFYIEPYHKGGYVSTFNLHHGAKQWNDCIIEIIEYGQRIAYNWQLTGSVLNSLDGWSNDARISGINGVSWSINKFTEPSE